MTTVVSSSEEETRAIAAGLAKRLHPGDIVAVSGGLGAGKTVFVKGLAEGLCADPGQVASPTFALLHEYEDREGRPVLVHLDLYRLAGTERELTEIGLPDLLAGRVAAVEWPSGPAERLLRFTHRVRLTPAGGERREIEVDEVP